MEFSEFSPTVDFLVQLVQAVKVWRHLDLVDARYCRVQPSSAEAAGATSWPACPSPSAVSTV